MRQCGAEMYTNLTYTRYNLSFTLFSPFSDLRVNLVSELGLDFACVAGEECQEALGATVDDVYFVQRYRVNHFSTLLNFAFRALNELRLYPLDQ